MKYRQKGYFPRRFSGKNSNSLSSILGVRENYGTSPPFVFAVPPVPPVKYPVIQGQAEPPPTQDTVFRAQVQNKENGSWNINTTLSAVPSLVTPSQTRAALLTMNPRVRKPKGGWGVLGSSPALRDPQGQVVPDVTPTNTLNEIRRTATSSYSSYFGATSPMSTPPPPPSVLHLIRSPSPCTIGMAPSEVGRGPSFNSIQQGAWVTRTSSYPPGFNQVNVQNASSYSVEELIDIICGDSSSAPTL